MDTIKLDGDCFTNVVMQDLTPGTGTCVTPISFLMSKACSMVIGETVKPGSGKTIKGRIDGVPGVQ